jgi:hypothetical protein
MITWFARHISRLFVASTFMFVIAACGGGGGGSGGFIPDGSGGENNQIYTLLVALADTNGNPTNSVTSTTPATLTVTVSMGPNAVPDLVVTAVTTVGIISPASGTALTNADGVATFQVGADDNLGAGTISVSVGDGDELVEDTITLEVGQASLQIGYFKDGKFIAGQIGLLVDSLPSAGSTLISLSVVDDTEELVATSEEITLRSDCAQLGLATLESPVITSAGSATATYTATGCEGTDDIVATLAYSSGQAIGQLSIASPQVSSLRFVSATPEFIALKGTGGAGRQETSEVTFQIVTETGAAISGQRVEFSLSTEVGGVSLLNASTFTDSGGMATTFVSSGDVSTPVRVIASIEAIGPDGQVLALSTISDLLIVSSGLPDQDSISLSSVSLNVGGAMNTDGLSTVVTVRMADKFNNPVPDGTAAFFETEYGSIGDSCTTTIGTCSVIWTSQAPRLPTFNRDLVRTIFDTSCPSSAVSGTGPCPADLGSIRGGRSAIRVSAIGEEYFVDQNGNGRYDEDEVFENLPEAFIDHNEDGVYTPFASPNDLTGAEETFVDFNSDGAYNLNVNPNTGSGVYNGILCPEEGAGIWCSRDLVNVRDNLVIVMSGAMNIIIVRSNGSKVTSLDEGVSYTAYFADEFNNPPAADASLTFSVKDECELVNEPVTQVPNTAAIGAFGTALQVRGGGFLTITAENGGAFSSVTFPCTAAAVPDPDPDGPGGGVD